MRARGGRIKLGPWRRLEKARMRLGFVGNDAEIIRMVLGDKEALTKRPPDIGKDLLIVGTPNTVEPAQLASVLGWVQWRITDVIRHAEIAKKVVAAVQEDRELDPLTRLLDKATKGG